jgi:Rieske Fe-S protein
MAEATVTPGNPTRRRVVTAAGGAGIAAALTACGTDAATSAGTGVAVTSAAAATPGGVATSQAAGTETSAAAGAAGAAAATTADIPEGGGKVFETEKVVVVQPTAGEFKAFSAVCTHQGCVVKEVVDGTINCPCHGAKFNIADGSVAAGPATQPLAAANVTVNGTSITLG